MIKIIIVLSFIIIDFISGIICALKNKKFYIERQEKTYSSLIVDTDVPTFNDRVQIIKTLGTFGNNPTIYLNTTGGVQ